MFFHITMTTFPIHFECRHAGDEDDDDDDDDHDADDDDDDDGDDDEIHTIRGDVGKHKQ